jgi:hypothetical protein
MDSGWNIRWIGLFQENMPGTHVFSMVPIDDGEQPCDISQLLQFWNILGQFWWLPQYSSSSKDDLGPRMDHPIFIELLGNLPFCLPRFIVSPHRVPMWPEIKSQQLPWPNWNPNWNSIYCHTSRNLGFNCNMDAVFHCCPSGAHHRWPSLQLGPKIHGKNPWLFP